MDKCHVIIVDTVNSKKFNSKNVKNILYEILNSNSDFLITKGNYLLDNIEFFDLDMSCDKVAIEKALLKEHLFINIISLSTLGASVKDDLNNGFHLKSPNTVQNSLSFRYHNLLRHAFIPKNRNSDNHFMPMKSIMIARI